MNRSSRITYIAAGLVVSGLLIGAGSFLALTGTNAGTTGAGRGKTSSPHSTALPTSAPLPRTLSGYVSYESETGVRIDIPVDADGDGPCTSNSKISILRTGSGPFVAELFGEPNDLGPRSHANGSVVTDDAGRVTAYVVADGDDLDSIGDRLCTESRMVGIYNHVGPGTRRVLQPGDTLIIRPDTAVEWMTE